MSFDVMNQMELFKEIATWNDSKHYIKDIGNAQTWTREELSSIIKDEAMLDAFFENVKICNLTAKERKERDKENIIPAFIEASRKLAVFRKAYYCCVNGVWVCDSKSKGHVLYEVFESTKLMSQFEAFLDHDKRSQVKELTMMDLKYIAVGNKFFDVEAGKMVDEAPDEFRTYRMRGFNYTYTRFRDHKSKLLADLCKHIGEDNLRYCLLTVARSMISLCIADRRAMWITGRTRTGKGTLLMLFKIFGLAPDVELTHDFTDGNDFDENYADVASLYPVVCMDEVERLNVRKTKKVCSDATMQCNPKGEKAVTVVNRGVPFFTSNTVPRSSEAGIYDKFAIMNTTGVTYKKDNRYFDKLTEEDYDEFGSILLSMCHDLYLHPDAWDSSKMSPEMERIHTQFVNDNFSLDSVLMNWEEDAVDDNGKRIKTTPDDAYRAYLYHANRDDIGTYQAIQDALATSRIAPASAPRGLSGVSRTSFIHALKGWVKFERTHDGIVFLGRPAKELLDYVERVESDDKQPEQGEDNLANFQGALDFSDFDEAMNRAGY